MLIHATVIETIGMHYFLHQWNPILSYILLLLNFYGLIYFLAEIQAIRLSPFLLTNEVLLLQVGITKSLVVTLSNIRSFDYYKGPEKFTRTEERSLFDARVADFILEKPTFEIYLKKVQSLRLLYGLKKQVNRIVLNVDEAGDFYHQLKDKVRHDTEPI